MVNGVFAPSSYSLVPLLPFLSRTLSTPSSGCPHMLSSLVICKYFPCSFFCRLYNQHMSTRPYPFPQLLQIIILITLNIFLQNHTSVNLLHNMIYHNTRSTIFQLAFLKVLKGALDSFSKPGGKLIIFIPPQSHPKSTFRTHASIPPTQ